MTAETFLLISVVLFCIMGILYFCFLLADKRQQKEYFEVYKEDIEDYQRGILQRLVNIEYYLSKKEDK